MEIDETDEKIKDILFPNDSVWCLSAFVFAVISDSISPWFTGNGNAIEWAPFSNNNLAPIHSANVTIERGPD